MGLTFFFPGTLLFYPLSLSVPFKFSLLAHFFPAFYLLFPLLPISPSLFRKVFKHENFYNVECLY